MVVTSFKGSVQTASSRFSPTRRGLAVKEILRRMPGSVSEQIEDHLHRSAFSDKTHGDSVIHDFHRVIVRPVVRRWVLYDDAYRSEDLSAAAASIYADALWRLSPDVAGRYVRAILPVIVRVVKPVAGIVRLNWDDDFRTAISDPLRESLRLSLFGPLAIFFFKSVAKGQTAWDVLVDSGNRPHCCRPFGWSPLSDRLFSTLRFLLTGQVSSRLQPNAFLYSPLAFYLIQLGLVQRVSVFQSVCSRCGRFGEGVVCANCGGEMTEKAAPRLLANSYLSRCKHRFARGAQRIYLLNEAICSKYPDDPEHAVRDVRTDCQCLRPEELFGKVRMMTLARKAARLMVEEIVVGRRFTLKQLALCADAAALKSPAVLVRALLYEESRIWDVLAEALAAPRAPDRAGRVKRINGWLGLLGTKFGVDSWTPLTATQAGTYLWRLRRRYLAILRPLIEKTTAAVT